MTLADDAVDVPAADFFATPESLSFETGVDLTFGSLAVETGVDVAALGMRNDVVWLAVAGGLIFRD